MTIILGDCLEVLKSYPDNHFTSIITDPPYGLSFMDKKWDYDVPSIDIWKECLRVIKPGGTMLCFAGSRTQHRMAINIEDAGFLIKDCLMWIYGQGFPKSLNIGKAIDKINGRFYNKEFQDFCNEARNKKGYSHNKVNELMGVAITGGGFSSAIMGNKEKNELPTKEMYIKLKGILDLDNRFDDLINTCEAERETIGEKSSGLSFGSGNTVGCFTNSLNENGLVNITAAATEKAKIFEGYGTALKPAYEPIIMAMKPNDVSYAENALKWGVSGINIDISRINTKPRTTHYEGNFRTGENKIFGYFEKGFQGLGKENRFPANILFDEEATKMLGEPSRFFYCAKASKSERNEGCEELEERGGIRSNAPRENEIVKTPKRQNNHPTVKPLKLMEYLIKLIMPPKNGLILDPFAGSGTTILAAKRLGYNAIGIELEEEYCKIARARIEGVKSEDHPQQLDLFNGSIQS